MKEKESALSFPFIFDHFRKLINENNQALEIIADMGAKMSGEFVFDRNYISSSTAEVAESVYRMIYHLDCMVPGKFHSLFSVYNRIRAELDSELEGNLVIPEGEYVIGYEHIDDTLATLVGGKNANLGVLGGLLGVRIPDGFAVTSHCFDQLLRKGECGIKIRSLLHQWEEGRETAEVSRELVRLVRGLSLPKPIHKSITKAVASVVSRSLRKKDMRFVVRSSAIGEDSEHSFAGQYESILNVLPEDVPDAYLRVLSSLYAPQAMEYRRQKNILESEAVMAVGVQEMVHARVSGVVYSLNAFEPDKDQLLVASTFGLGAGLVGGKQRADQFHVSRKPPYEILGMDIVHKKKIVKKKQEGDGVINSRLNPRLRDRPSLGVEELREVVNIAMRLEKYFRHPQDIEFALDERKNPVILQSRSLNIGQNVPKLICDFSRVDDNYPILFDGVGDIVQEGVGMGVVHNVRSEEELNLTPQGAILVTHFSSPNFARVLKRVNGVITDIGSQIGHLSTIAREFRVPMIINTQRATKVLKSGMEITLDAQEHKIYEGLMPELCYYEFAEDPFEQTYEFRLLRRLLKKISPLKLVDPAAATFRAEACRTLHDLLRFVHEKSVEVLVDRNFANDIFLKEHARRLQLTIPLDLTVIDFALCRTKRLPSRLQLHEIKSVPLKALARGMCAEGLWEREPVEVDMKSFMSSMTKTFATNVSDPRFVGQNLAVTSGDYMNVSLRLGYHFSMIDSICSGKEIDNYVYFRFFGGVTDPKRRSRRGRMIQQILMANDFMVSSKGDLVVGRLKGASSKAIREKIFILGALVSYTRQLDVKLVDEYMISNYVSQFTTLMQRYRKVGLEKEDG
ncbi:PEP/pyruvate-binding domain-containing protein [Desulforhopalus singaporensis]|uniref:PEP/pyruvate-binding domain-containing protein n=1 Tax=Desulforhopalus singaporensis TaxID=91360 RepID=UPI00115FA0C9|nr:PEP/pyruvate-binding domain-containing protein [Desulforhopalus singaporensis]